MFGAMRLVIIFRKNWYEDLSYDDFEKIITEEKFENKYPRVKLIKNFKVKIVDNIYAMLVEIKL